MSIEPDEVREAIRGTHDGPFTIDVSVPTFDGPNPSWKYVREATIGGKLGAWWRIDGKLKWIRDSR